MLDDPSMDMTGEVLASEMQTMIRHVGESLATGRLRSLGYRVSRERVH